MKVSFENVSAHWIDVSFAFGDQIFSDSISSITPVLDDFCDVLSAALYGVASRPIKMCSEPVEYEVSFLPDIQSASIRLVVQEWADSRRDSLVRPKVIFAMEGSGYEVVVPFWRALRKLQTSLPKRFLEEQWGSGFPDFSLANLTQRIEALKAKAANDQLRSPSHKG